MGGCIRHVLCWEGEPVAELIWQRSIVGLIGGKSSYLQAGNMRRNSRVFWLQLQKQYLYLIKQLKVHYKEFLFDFFRGNIPVTIFSHLKPSLKGCKFSPQGGMRDCESQKAEVSSLLTSLKVCMPGIQIGMSWEEEAQCDLNGLRKSSEFEKQQK